MCIFRLIEPSYMMTVCVPLQRVHTGSSMTHRFVGLKRALYTNFSRKLNLCSCIDIISLHEKRLFRTPSQLTHEPFFFIATALTCPLYSFIYLTSSCINSLLSFLFAVFHIALVTTPSPCLIYVTVPTISLCCDLVSAFFAASRAVHSLPELTVPFVSLPLSSWLVLSVMSCRT